MKIIFAFALICVVALTQAERDESGEIIEWSSITPYYLSQMGGFTKELLLESARCVRDYAECSNDAAKEAAYQKMAADLW